MRQAAVGCKLHLRHGRLLAIMAGVKRNAAKSKSTASGAKKPRTKAEREKTGAPPAGFLSALEMEAPIHYLITGSRYERRSHHLLSSGDIMKRVWLDLLELAERIEYPKVSSRGLDNSAGNLATVAILAAQLLEYSSSSKSYEVSQLTSFAASEREFWPVLLRLGKKLNKKGERCLEGADKAKAYLIRIKQGQDAADKLKYFHDPNANKFNRAAELLLHELVRWRERGACGKITPWAKKLFALGDLPMTKDNVTDWWAVAKPWMDEQWKEHPELFTPLVKACKSKGVALDSGRHDLYGCEVQRNVIDLRLKESFFALAKPADL